MLRPDVKPFYSHEQFLSECQENVSADIFQQLQQLSLNVVPQDTMTSAIPVAELWNNFETALRNTLAHLRAARLKRTAPEPALTAFEDVFTVKDIQDAYTAPSPAEREQKLDSIRWKFLDSLEDGHDFDVNAVAIYALKLLILERTASRQVNEGIQAYGKLVDNGVAQAAQNRC